MSCCRFPDGPVHHVLCAHRPPPCESCRPQVERLEHALCEALQALPAGSPFIAQKEALSRMYEAEAEAERLAQRALDAEQGRDRAVAQELRVRAALELAMKCKGSLGVCDHCRETIGRATTSPLPTGPDDKA